MSALANSGQRLLAALLLAAAIPFTLNLGVSSIWDANEAFYAQTPREMMQAADYVIPTFNFQLRVNKPILSYWNVAASYHLFGISEWSERVPIALGAFVIVATAFGLGRLAGGTTAGLISALVLLTSPRLLLLARRIIIDVHITMWMGVILLCFALSEMRPQHRRRYLTLMYVAAGFGVLTKGPVAVFLPAVVFFVYLASQQRLRDLGRMMLPAGAVISLSIVVPWYYLLYREYGWEYIGSFIFGENLGRFTETVGEQSRGALFYLPVMLADLFPWSLFIPVALWWAVRERLQDRVAIVVFFSLSSTKEDLYILPIIVAEAALIGAMLSSALEGAKHARVVGWALSATGVLMLVGGGGVLWLFSQRYSLSGTLFIATCAMCGGAVSVVMGARRRIREGIAAIALSLALVCWAIVLTTLPDFERYKPVKPFAEIIRARASVGAIVGTYQSGLPSMVYYLNRPVMDVISADHLRAVFHSSSDIYFVMPESEYARVKDRLPVSTYVLARGDLFDVRPMNFVQGSELRRLVLVSNRE
jgi:4-amino-4-deoxy-L-arabinose transferase-like glycosyltransferase